MTIIGGADYELAWPREVLLSEINVLVQRGREQRKENVEALLSEAFTTSTPLEDFRGASSGRTSDPWGGPNQPGAITQHTFLATLTAAAPGLQEATAPSPYWPQKQAATDAQVRPVDLDAARRRFVTLIGELEQEGHLGRAFPKICVDDHDSQEVDRSEVLDERLGVPGLWPLRPEAWTDDLFFGLIEVFHDLVARPRARTWHSWDFCGWHFDEYAIEPARTLYTWRLNRILSSTGVPLRLASIGEDAGRLVRVTDDSRGDLVVQVLASTTGGIQGRVAHAVALFRARDASDLDRHSATITLAGILEDRRALLKASLYRADEGALFMIANEFAIRHQSEAQKRDYDPAFVDWIFWWYLSTIELTERILLRG